MPGVDLAERHALAARQTDRAGIVGAPRLIVDLNLRGVLFGAKPGSPSLRRKSAGYGLCLGLNVASRPIAVLHGRWPERSRLAKSSRSALRRCDAEADIGTGRLHSVRCCIGMVSDMPSRTGVFNGFLD